MSLRARAERASRAERERSRARAERDSDRAPRSKRHFHPELWTGRESERPIQACGPKADLKSSRAARGARRRQSGNRRQIYSVERHMKFYSVMIFSGTQLLNRPRSAGPQVVGAPLGHVAEEQDPAHLRWGRGKRRQRINIGINIALTC